MSRWSCDCLSLFLSLKISNFDKKAWSLVNPLVSVYSFSISKECQYRFFFSSIMRNDASLLTLCWLSFWSFWIWKDLGLQSITVKKWRLCRCLLEIVKWHCRVIEKRVCLKTYQDVLWVKNCWQTYKFCHLLVLFIWFLDSHFNK